MTHSAFRVSRRRAVLVLATLAVAVAAMCSGEVRAAATACASATECGYTNAQVTNTEAFLTALGGSVLQFDGSWDVVDDMCTLPYVQCTTEGLEISFDGAELFDILPALDSTIVGAQVMVSKIDFSGSAGMASNVPPSWSALTNLQAVSFAGVDMYGALPASWSALTNLVSLDFSNTPLAATLPDAWSTLTKLQTFACRSSALSGDLPASWSAMAALTSFDANGARFSGPLPESWGTMTALSTFNVGSNALTGTLPASWGAMTAMSLFDVSNNMLTGSIPTSYGAMASLRSVDLRSNTFCGCLPAAWKAIEGIVINANPELSGDDCSTVNACDASSSSLFSSSSSSSSSSSPSSSSSASSSSGSGASSYSSSSSGSSSSSNRSSSSSDSSSSSSSSSGASSIDSSSSSSGASSYSTSSSSINSDASDSSSSINSDASDSSSSSSVDLCNAEVTMYTPDQVFDTTVLLTSFASAFAALSTVWGAECRNFCTWAGVTCKADGVTVNVSGVGLIGIMPDVPVDDLDVNNVVIRVLDLSNNPGLTGNLGIDWLTLPNLWTLDVSNCGFFGPLPF